jgi:hypothetical protein
MLCATCQQIGRGKATQYRIHEEGNELLKQTGKAGAASRGNLGAVIAAGWPDVDDASRPAL